MPDLALLCYRFVGDNELSGRARDERRGYLPQETRLAYAKARERGQQLWEVFEGMTKPELLTVRWSLLAPQIKRLSGGPRQ